MVQTPFVTGKIETIASNGEGILRAQGRVVFVPFTAIGDVVTARIVKEKPQFAHGKIEHIETPSTSRVEPQCRHFGVCPGCQLQHIDYAHQLRIKQKIVEDALTRIGGFHTLPNIQMVGAKTTWAYRRHIRLHLRASENGFRLGYVDETHQSLVEVEECPIFVDASDKWIFSLLREVVVSLPPTSIEQQGTVAATKVQGEKFFLTFDFSHRSPNAASMVLEQLQHRDKRIYGIQLRDKHRQMVFGQIDTSLSTNAMNVAFEPTAFVQSHPEQSEIIYDEVIQIINQYPASCVLDLYSGIGVTSILLAKNGHAVTAVESNLQLVKIAQKNAKNANIAVDTCQGMVELYINTLMNEKRPRVVLLNPPRTGAHKNVMATLTQAKPQAVVYISCNSSTLARDLKFLGGAGYRLVSVTAYDMFPQTIHVETVVHAVLN